MKKTSGFMLRGCDRSKGNRKKDGSPYDFTRYYFLEDSKGVLGKKPYILTFWADATEDYEILIDTAIIGAMYVPVRDLGGDLVGIELAEDQSEAQVDDLEAELQRVADIRKQYHMGTYVRS